MAKPLISVIIPIYNSASYLREAIDSVTRQSIGFRDNIEILLVNDGSSDGSEAICVEYKSLYRDNISYTFVNNGGVSNARNVGINLARGEYVHFMDSDDIISVNFYSKAVSFLRKYNNTDVVASKIKFFDEIIDSHPLNFKFKETRVINLTQEPDNPIMHVISCLFRRSAIEGLYFDSKLSISEDVKFLSDVLIKKRHLGVMAREVYYYRKRTNSTSAVGGKESSADYYLKVPKYSYAYILQEWKILEKASWAEFTILYDISYRLSQKKQNVLNNTEEKKYKTSIKSLIASCSDQAIATNNYFSLQQKLYALECKYGQDYQKKLKTNSKTTKIDNFVIFNHGDSEVYVDFLTHIRGNIYRVEGYINIWSIGAVLNPCVAVGNRKYKLKASRRAQLEESFLGDVYHRGGAFEAEIEFGLRENIRFYENIESDSPRLMSIRTGLFTRFGSLKYTYRLDESRLIKRTKSEFISYPYAVRTHIKLEVRMIMQILVNWRFSTAKNQLKKLASRNLAQLSFSKKVFEVAKPFLFMAEAVYNIPRSVLLRCIYYVVAKNKKKPLWIVSDRAMAAGDNGEAFFRYLMNRDDVAAKVYYVISSRSKDYDRMRLIGPTLKHGSLRHKINHLLADKIISSQADIETTNPFIRQVDHFADLLNFEFVFLQHGVIRHDLSEWLNRFNKNIGLFVVTAKKEYQSILSNPYYYKRNQIILSGLPRYDRLKSRPRKKIILAPTYRKNLVRMKTDKNGNRKYDPAFKSTEYREFYNDLITDSRLKAVMLEHGVKGEFYIHPAFSAQKKDFEGSELFEVMSFPYDYRAAFEKGALLISDHSSVMFDFAYLRKPVLYAHFDAETFFEGHTYDRSNFFSDVNDGFGRVCGDYDELVEAIIDSIKSGFVLTDKYRKRIDNFFEYKDTSNSSRLYDSIVKDD